MCMSTAFNTNGRFLSIGINFQCVKEGVVCKSKNGVCSLMLIASYDQSTKQLCYNPAALAQRN